MNPVLPRGISKSIQPDHVLNGFAKLGDTPRKRLCRLGRSDCWVGCMVWGNHDEACIGKRLGGQMMVSRPAANTIRHQHNLVLSLTQWRVHRLRYIKGTEPSGNRCAVGRIPDMDRCTIPFDYTISGRFCRIG